MRKTKRSFKKLAPLTLSLALSLVAILSLSSRVGAASVTNSVSADYSEFDSNLYPAPWGDLRQSMTAPSSQSGYNFDVLTQQGYSSYISWNP